MFWKNQLSESTTNVNEVRNKNAEGSNEFVFVSEAENSKLSPKSASTHAEVSSTKVKEFGSGCAGDQEACLAKCECSGNSEKPTLDTELSSVAEKNAIVSDEASQRCPMCGTHLPENLAIINHHIDECLNRYFLVCFHRKQVLLLMSDLHLVSPLNIFFFYLVTISSMLYSISSRTFRRHY